MAIVVIPSTERCRNCFTTVQFEANDVKEVHEYDDDDILMYYHYITCPCCGAEICVD